jgi:hypothetical protein
MRNVREKGRKRKNTRKMESKRENVCQYMENKDKNLV